MVAIINKAYSFLRPFFCLYIIKMFTYNNVAFFLQLSNAVQSFLRFQRESYGFEPEFKVC